ncbi:MAG: YcaO-like family protein [Desulfosalsimonas sp.]|uniref:YcaO-like family protein n=1 Tax=Desulfosalsimonas sp. TaxID=3073848 RepID=UPI0039710F23
MDPKWTLKDAYKTFTADQDKITDPQETVTKVRRRFAEQNLAVLAKTARIDTGRLDIPVYVSVCGPDARALTGTAKQMGKGATPAQAEASAVMELVERFSFYSFAADPANFVEATRPEMGASALPFEAIAASVHDDSEDLEAAARVFDTLPFKWAMGANLTRGHDVRVPFEWFFAINEFNGTSAGNCLEEALCQGICEIVERHVSDRVCREQISLPGIDPASATDPMVREMLEKYEKNGIRVFLSDFSLDTGIATVGALAFDPETFPHQSEIVWTAGTAPDPEKALSRALAETAQLAGDFHTGSNYVASGLPKPAGPEDVAHITEPGMIKKITDLPDISDSNIRSEVRRCIAALKQQNLDVITMDTTHPGLGVCALYTVVPGARFRERAAAGSVGMFCARLITEKFDPQEVAQRLAQMDAMMPGKYYVQFYLGKTRMELGETRAAIALFQSALDLGPHAQDVASIYSYMGQAWKAAGDYDKALQSAEKGLEWDHERTDLLNLAGFCHFKKKDHEAAVDNFSRVIALNPASGIDHANLAVNYREMGETEAAVRFFRIALDLDPSLEFARQHLEALRK